MYSELFKEIIKRSLKIPTVITNTSKPRYSINSGTIVRQLDSALISVGFKLSKGIFDYLNTLPVESAKDVTSNILEAVKEMVGDHVLHNAYFINFPDNVPDTLEFWAACIKDALLNPESAEKISCQLQTVTINLLDLPKYGKYQHTYEDLMRIHDQIISSVKNRITILHLGKTLHEEITDLYQSIAKCLIPLNEKDLKLLQNLATICLREAQPASIPVRENKAIINQVRLNNNCKLSIDTPTDILRLSRLLSDGDATLVEKTKFKSFPRQIRRKLIQELDHIIKKFPAKLEDVNQYREQWKRLGERLHVYEYKQWPNAQDVFAVARKDKRIFTIAGKIENAFSEGNINKGISLLSVLPGRFFRNLDRIIRLASPNEMNTLIKVIPKVVPKVSTRVILSVREHLQNRFVQRDKRIFINKKGTAWVTDETRIPLSPVNVRKIFTILDEEVYNRLQPAENLIVDKEILKVAIPLSNKDKSDGFAVMPRGSIMPITNENLRFFIHWKQKSERTDYDLSAIMLDKDFKSINHLSYTDLKGYDGVHSGDLTEAPNGASEFIDINLTKTKCRYIIPSINIYSGEKFIDVDESFFGFMQRTSEQKGMPFEPTTVKTKFDIRGKGKVALPIVFIRNDKNEWVAKWLNIYLNGMPNMNRVEENKQSSTLLVKSIVEHEYLYMSYLIMLLQRKAKTLSRYRKQQVKDTDTFIGLEVPEKLSDNATAFTLNNLQDLLPI